MFTDSQLRKALNEAYAIIDFGIDTFTIRKNFEEAELKTEQKAQIIDYISENVDKKHYTSTKKQVNDQEFLPYDYFKNPEFSTPRPRKFRGCYSPVIYKTIGGLISFSLTQQVKS